LSKNAQSKLILKFIICPCEPNKKKATTALLYKNPPSSSFLNQTNKKSTFLPLSSPPLKSLPSSLFLLNQTVLNWVSLIF